MEKTGGAYYDITEGTSVVRGVFQGFSDRFCEFAFLYFVEGFGRHPVDICGHRFGVPAVTDFVFLLDKGSLGVVLTDLLCWEKETVLRKDDQLLPFWMMRHPGRILPSGPRISFFVRTCLPSSL